MKNIGTGKRDEFYRQNAEENKGEETKKYSKTRPDTRPSVADGWAKAEIRIFPLFNSSATDLPTNQPTDQPTIIHHQLTR